MSRRNLIEDIQREYLLLSATMNVVSVDMADDELEYYMKEVHSRASLMSEGSLDILRRLAKPDFKWVETYGSNDPADIAFSQPGAPAICESCGMGDWQHHGQCEFGERA